MEYSLKTDVVDLGSSKKKLTVEVPFHEIKPLLDQKYREYQKKIRIEGFRKGKVPLSILRKRFGRAIEVELSDELAETFFKKAVNENGLDLVAPGKIQDIRFEEDKPFRMTAEVEVEPEIKVTAYKGLRAEKEIRQVTDTDVDQWIGWMREQRAETRPLDAGARDGDIVEGDVQALDHTGIPIVGQKWEGRSFELGRPPVGDMVKEQLAGAKAGDSRRFSLTQTESTDGRSGEKVYHYRIDVKSVMEKNLPVLDDAFARSVGDFDSVEDMRSKIRKRMEEEQEQNSERALRHRLADEVIRKNNLHLPDGMVDHALKVMWENHHQQQPDDLDETAFREKYRANAIWNLKWNRLWKKIADSEDLAVSDETLTERIDQIAEANPGEKTRIQTLFKNQDRRERLRDEILEEKVVDFLKEHGKIKEVKIKSKN